MKKERSQRIKQETIDLILDLYVNQKLSITKISKQIGRCADTIVRTLHRNNISIPDQIEERKKKLPEAIKLFQEGVSLTKIASLLHTDRDTLSAELKTLGFTVENKQNKTKFNENIFDSIDTEEKAYWLGFLYADGCVHSSGKTKTQYTIEITLQNSDKRHLIKFLQFLQHENTHPSLKIINGDNYWRIAVTNKHLWETLNEKGCVCKKSLILKYPTFLSEDLHKHFIRGYFDGDGCISYQKNPLTVSPRCSVISTSEFISVLNDILKQQDITGPISKDKRWADNTRVISFCSSSSYKLLKWLYTDCSVYLDRKFKRAQFFMNSCRSLKEFNELLASEIGGGCDANTEVSSEITKGSETP
jgi:intein/homing endonuclease